MQTHPHPTRIMPLFAAVAAGLCMLILLSSFVMADYSTVKVEKMAYADLNRLIAEGDCNCLMVFMTAWCGPCIEEMPVLNRLYRRFGAQGVRFIGISVDSGGPAAIEIVIRKKKVTFPVFWVGEAAVDELNIFGVPMIFMIKNGQIVEKIPGKCSYDFLESKILNFLKP
jgi:thiol-disulfide isomerase/thioredoxin